MASISPLNQPVGTPTANDHDPAETREWLEALESVLRRDGSERAHHLLTELSEYAKQQGVSTAEQITTDYVNTIDADKQPAYPGNLKLEKEILAYLRWNAMAMVVKANKESSEYGGHIATYASAAQLYEVGYQHFWRAQSANHPGDMIFIQGHASPGIYSRAFLEGRLSSERLSLFRREIEGEGKGLSSYPHPWLMPDFWQFPTVSMGLGGMMAVYQARFMKYLQNRGLIPTTDQKVWSMMGDGEIDEPESLAGLSLAGREHLDNLVVVVNCNLQRLDGPVRGNGKIIQELEGVFKGAGWNVIKVVWGSKWDELLAKDSSGKLRQRMMEAVDGEYQNYGAKDGAYTRENFFNKYPETAELVKDLSDEDIEHLKRGGHDFEKIYAAYKAATETRGKPTVILAKTIKGFGMGVAGQGKNITHQKKSLDEEAIKVFRDRFRIPLKDEALSEMPFLALPEGGEAKAYLDEKREALGGFLPARDPQGESLKVPELSDFNAFLNGTEGREASTTMIFVRMLTMLLKDKNIGETVVPVVPDEARTFGMEGLFKQVGIYASRGQLYTPEDADQLMSYREDQSGQILQEGINEAGSFCSWLAAATSYANYGKTLVPFYIYYSMFGFQRIGDFAYAAGDMRARGFLIGGTAGRTTLAGEGLQHQDGHMLLLASTIPNCVSYDPCFGYELAVIIQDGLKRMMADQEDVYYYITAMNENYTHPKIPKGVEDGIRKGLYPLSKGKKGKARVQLLGSGTILREVIAAADMLETQFDVPCDIWSATSFNELRRDALEVQHWNRCHPEDDAKQSYVEQTFEGIEGPFIAATDYMRAVSDQIREWVPGTYHTLGTDGFGRSDGRAALRKHFEVDSKHICVAALYALAEDGIMDKTTVSRAIRELGINPDKPFSATV